MSACNVSVVIATYNSEQTLKRCIDSVLDQTVRPQVIVVDGGSSDATVEIVLSFGDRIDVFFSEPDQGVYDAWNKAIPRAIGEWIVFVGSDDYFASRDSLTSACDFANRGVPDVSIIYGSVIVVDDQERTLRIDNKAHSNIHAALRRGMAFTHTGTLHRRVLFEQFGLFDSQFRIAGDYDFALRTLREGAAVYCEGYRIIMGGNGVSNSVESRRRLLQELSLIRRKNSVPWSLVVDGYILFKRAIYWLLT